MTSSNGVAKLITQNGVKEKEPEVKNYKMKIYWRKVIFWILIHLLSLHGLYLLLVKCKLQTVFLFSALYMYSLSGVSAGVHRLWSHKSYKAHWIVRVFLMAAQTMSMQNSIVTWARDHRQHHKYVDTDADPHNSNRGFVFCHIGWLMCSRHPEVRAGLKKIDISDLWDDSVVSFQYRYYYQLLILIGVLLPTMIPMICWAETLANAFLICVILRLVITWNSTWMINSFAHMFGTRQYDVSANPRESMITTNAMIGEGYHSYHHTFPWDYASTEHHWRYSINLTTTLLDLLAKFDLVYDRKVASETVVTQRVKRTGDWKLYQEQKWLVSQRTMFDILTQYIFGTYHIWLWHLIRVFTYSPVETQ